MTTYRNTPYIRWHFASSQHRGIDKCVQEVVMAAATDWEWLRKTEGVACASQFSFPHGNAKDSLSVWRNRKR